MRDFLEITEKKNWYSLINQFMYENCVSKVQHKKMMNHTVILISARYCN